MNDELKKLIKKLELEEGIAKKRYELEELSYDMDAPSYEDNGELERARADWKQKFAVCVAVSKALGQDEQGNDIYFKLLKED